MRAFIVPEFGQPGAVGERPAPEPGEGQILLERAAEALDRQMTRQVRGKQVLAIQEGA